MQTRIRYLITSATKFLLGKGFACPSCGTSNSKVVSRKYAITELRRCCACQLQFRVPTTTQGESVSFYQREYNQGFRTDIPSLKDVENLKRTGFSGTEMDYSKYTEILSALGCKPGDSLFDYGCSWGYGSWQLSQAGYNVTALEISVQRCEFARRHLGINAYQNSECVNGPFDVFFSCHVLEHVPSVAQSIEFARRVLKSGGWFVAFTPNGCEEFRKTNPKVWNHLWGLVHPNFLDDKYYHGIFRHDIHLITSSSYDLKSIKEWATENPKEQKSRSLSLNGSELLIVARLMD